MRAVEPSGQVIGAELLDADGALLVASALFIHEVLGLLEEPLLGRGQRATDFEQRHLLLPDPGRAAIFSGNEFLFLFIRIPFVLVFHLQQIHEPAVHTAGANIADHLSAVLLSLIFIAVHIPLILRLLLVERGVIAAPWQVLESHGRGQRYIPGLGVVGLMGGRVGEPAAALLLVVAEGAVAAGARARSAGRSVAEHNKLFDMETRPGFEIPRRGKQSTISVRSKGMGLQFLMESRIKKQQARSHCFTRVIVKKFFNSTLNKDFLQLRGFQLTAS